MKKGAGLPKIIWGIFPVLLIIWLYIYKRTVFDTRESIDIIAFSSFGQFISGIATTIGLVYLFSQVEEMRLQREAADKPDLYATNSITKMEYNVTGYIDILNAGRGHALNIGYSWEYDYNFVDTFLNSKGYSKVKRYVGPFISKTYAEDLYKDGIDGRLQIILTGTQNTVKINLPPLLLKYFVEFYHDAGMLEDAFEGKTLNRMPNPNLRLNYKDLNGNNFAKKIEIQYSFSMMSDSLILSPI